MKRFVVALCAGLLAISAVAADKDDENKPSVWMKKKLEYSERILGGLASGDFAEIAQAAHSMNVMSQLEKWVHANTPEYRKQLKNFQNANERIIEMAKKDDLDGTAQAFVEVTLSCVNCHKLVRDGKKGVTEPSK